MPDDHAVLTGPISGTVTCADGTVVDVSAHHVFVDSQERAIEVAELVGARYVAEGHPAHMYTDVPFRHDPIKKD